MSDTKGFAVIELLMQGLVVAALLVSFVMIGIQSTYATSKLVETRERAHYAAMKLDLENLSALQAIHFADQLSYSSSPTALGFSASGHVRVSIEVSDEGWFAVATHPGLGEGDGCVTYRGGVELPDHVVRPEAPGTVVCTD